MNKEIIGDDYPTYEDSVKLTLAEREPRKSAVTDKILLSRVLHRLACIETDIKIIARHIENTCPKQFEQPSRNEDGSVYAECAWHNISNIEIACDLNDDSPLDWESRVKTNLNKANRKMSEYDTLEQHSPMTLREVFEKVREGCQMHMNQLDEKGYCSESDDYVVALAFFEDYIEGLKRNGAWE